MYCDYIDEMDIHIIMSKLLQIIKFSLKELEINYINKIMYCSH